jgi:hypothetical protein
LRNVILVLNKGDRGVCASKLGAIVILKRFGRRALWVGLGMVGLITLTACGQPASDTDEVARLKQELALERAKNAGGSDPGAQTDQGPPTNLVLPPAPQPQPLEMQVGYSTAIRCAGLASWFTAADEAEAAELRTVLINAKRVARYHGDRMSTIPNIEAAVQNELIQIRFGTTAADTKALQDDYQINCAALKVAN